MKKVSWSKLILFRVIGISLLITVVIFWGLRHNPRAIEKFRRIISPSNTASPRKWILESQKLHTMCGHMESKRTEYFKEEPFKAVIKNYSRQVEKVNNQSYRYLENNNNLCESCRKNQFLGIDGQQIVVYRGTPDRPGPITERIEINLSKLPEEEIEDLKKGIPFRDGKEKLQLLEGLNGLSTE